jgi:ligand-binding SRPBCC domain-containing protein
MIRGTLIDYALSVHGLPMRWTTLITEYDPPHCFVDVQLRGPYSYWHHRHRFESVVNGTRIEDEVHYGMPFGPVGRVAHRLLVSRDLQRIFSHRREIIANKFGKCE